jgi:hypothetical protein
MKVMLAENLGSIHCNNQYFLLIWIYGTANEEGWIPKF